MELVYLWVEKYKNIDKQGFNFSPRFNCKYDEDKNELTIDENKNYIENFFGDNINMTAIVGKNGSGKSNIFKSINEYKIDDKLKIVVLEIKDKLILFHNLNNFISTNIVISNNTFDITTLNNKSLKDNYNGYKNILFPTFTESLPLFLKINIIANNNKLYDTLNIIEMLQHSNIYIPFKKPETLYMEVKVADDLDKDIQTQINGRNINNDFIEKELFYQDTNEYKIKLLKFYSLAQYIHLFQDLGNSYSHIVDKCNQESITSIDKLIEIYLSAISQIGKKEEINDVINYIEKNFTYYNLNFWKINLENLDRTFISKYKLLFTKTTNVSLEMYDTFNFSFSDKFSSGEYQFLTIFSKIYNYCRQDTLLLIDEGDALLHPNWQKSFIDYLNKFLINNFSDFKYHLILTSHSPFIISDLPKENVIFLDTDEEGKCKVVDGLKEKKQTFGANIHTLLSDSFFMEDSLMGEFAKGKINAIIEFHGEVEEESKKEKSNFDSLRVRYEKEKTKFWQTQSIIGEEYLKQVLKNHLIDIENILSGYDEAKRLEIARLRDEADKLESM